MAIAVVFPVTCKAMITVARLQSLVVGKGHDHSSQISRQCLMVLTFGFTIEVPEAAGMVLDQGFSYREVCRQLDAGETGLRHWVEQLLFERVGDPLSNRTQRAVMVRGAKDHAASR